MINKIPNINLKNLSIYTSILGSVALIIKYNKSKKRSIEIVNHQNDNLDDVNTNLETNLIDNHNDSNTNRLEIIDQTKDKLIQLLGNIRSTNQEFVDKIITHRKLLCDENIKKEIETNDISINGRNKKTSMESIYINTLQLNDNIIHITNCLEETIKWIYWFKDEDEINCIYQKLIYHDKNSIIDTLNKLEYNHINIPNVNHKQEIIELINKLKFYVDEYENETKLNIGLSEYFTFNNLISDKKTHQNLDQLCKIIRSRLNYFKVSFDDIIRSLYNDISYINWINYKELQEGRDNFISPIKIDSDIDSELNFYDYIKKIYY
jgi:hypothetical protein